VKQARDAEGQTIWAWKRHNGLNQRWTILYTKGKKADRTKGFNKTFGMEMNRPFYLQSRLPMKRVLRTNSNNVVIMNLADSRRDRTQ